MAGSNIKEVNSSIAKWKHDPRLNPKPHILHLANCSEDFNSHQCLSKENGLVVFLT